MNTNYKYKKLVDFRKAHPSQYVWLYKKNLLEQLCHDMGWEPPKIFENRKQSGHWNIKENCIEEAKKYNSYNDMNINCKVVIKQIVKNGWKLEIIQLMGWEFKKKPKGYWDVKENCIEEVKKYKNFSELSSKNHRLSKALSNNGWLNEVIQLMGWELKRIPDGYWEIKENCIEDAKKYKTKLEYNKKSKSYRSSVNNEWINEICDLMGWKKSVKQIQKPSNYWNLKENCIEEAKKYSDYTEFRLNSQTAVKSCRKNGWLNEIIQLMGWEKPKQQKPNKYWHVKENCIEDARKYNKKTDWYKNSSSAVNAAKLNNWYEECTKHITADRKPHGYWTK
jgi:hypothetical protein